MKLKLFIIIFGVLVFKSNIFPFAIINAQEELIDEDGINLEEENKPVEIEDIPGLRATFEQNTQDPGSKEVEFVMILASRILSDRVQLTWELTGPAAFAEGVETARILRLEEDRIYELPIVIQPQPRSGIVELVGKVESFELGRSFVVTVRKNFAINDNAEVLPITDEYRSARTRRTLTRIATYVGGGAVLTVVGFFGLRQFIKWYDKNPVEEYNEK